MNASPTAAAQYIRMSTDKQDLSPVTQREAIAAYAEARGIKIVATYEDEGRSGVHIKNRPGLLKLLKDVVEDKRFGAVLVYDVSRWGRFQDTDAAAYYEYHCRLHGAEVIYVGEMFGAEVNPITALLKSMKRAMAAEYSRELSKKARAGQAQVIARGHQMGALPPLGYRRCSVSADGQHRVVLAHRQRKLAATDRIEWVLAEPAEVELVKRICDLYTRQGLTFADIARLGTVEGWRDHRGRALSGRSLATLLRNEALVGNFVWGRGTHRGRVADFEATRQDGGVPRLIDDESWRQIQRRAEFELSKKQSNEQMLGKLRTRLQEGSTLASRDLRVLGLASRQTLRKRLGPWEECIKLAGGDPVQLSRALSAQAAARIANARQLGRALADRLSEAGHVVSYDGKLHAVLFPSFTMGVLLLWPALGEHGQTWQLQMRRVRRDIDFGLVVRMEEAYRPRDFFLASSADLAARFPNFLTDPTPKHLHRFRCEAPEQLLERIGSIAARAS
ncbi:recombinase family protein [Piscinibacter koreensis]|uniref:Recombinase family protein n=1 Tax=Piscinibacter koreensis TaxID=2742824 RepID=A0A7Y6NP55_9BURK|nr:recombinase family protein [Schlegelella koreensis]NUZ06729.1 recombinase family protein [Schlegelella koreensis]